MVCSYSPHRSPCGSLETLREGSVEMRILFPNIIPQNKPSENACSLDEMKVIDKPVQRAVVISMVAPGFPRLSLWR